MQKTSWEKHENYHSRIIYIENLQVIYKDYWDPGKNPNITKISFDDILSGKWDYEIVIQFSGAVLNEIKTKILEINAKR